MQPHQSQPLPKIPCFVIIHIHFINIHPPQLFFLQFILQGFIYNPIKNFLNFLVNVIHAPALLGLDPPPTLDMSIQQSLKNHTIPYKIKFIQFIQFDLGLGQFDQSLIVYPPFSGMLFIVVDLMLFPLLVSRGCQRIN